MILVNEPGNPQKAGSLAFEYRMALAFDAPVQEHRFTLRCFPATDLRQKITALSYELSPEGPVSEGTDSFGNFIVYGNIAASHTAFEVSVRGTAENASGSEEEICPPDWQLGIYRMETPLTRADSGLLAFLNGLDRKSAGASRLEQAVYLMHALSAVFRYQTGSTSLTTTAAEAFSQGTGVCQDFAHILIALCRAWEIPARYAAGLTVGEGRSHAWVEIADQGKWIGLDPTADRLIDENYILFSHGRDYKDALLDRGLYRGFAGQKQIVSAHVYLTDSAL